MTKQISVILKRFESPDEVRMMQKGKFELVQIGGMTIGRATYEPGWKWSEHVGPSVGATRCHVEHVGLVLSGTATAAFDDGRVVERLVRAVVHLLFVAHQLVARPYRHIDPATIRIAFVMSVVRLLDRDVAAVDVVAKFVEPSGVSHYQVVDLLRFFQAAVGDVDGQLHN